MIRHMYCHVYEYRLVKEMQRTIRRGDTFIDVGANIGYLTSIGAGLVGPTGQVHSFEPVPEYFKILKKVKELNPSHQIFVNNAALGEKEGEAHIDVTSLHNIGWNTMVPRFMEPSTIKMSYPIKVIRLDDYIADMNLDNISLIKIDVEGFEFPVLKGLRDYLQEKRPLLIIEVVPEAYPLLGSSMLQLSEYMAEFGYKSAPLDDLLSVWASGN